MANLSIRDFYKGKNIFITGGTGFMGKVLVEKLLYSIPEVGNIYILIRPKRGKSVNQRIEEICRIKLFDRLKAEQPNALSKIKAIQGDVLMENLGLDDSQISTLSKEVSIIFHCAATLKLEAPLKDNVNMNTCGTQRTLNVAKRFEKLVIFVHLSTAFCYPDYEVLGERVHEPPVDPEKVIRLIEWLDNEQLDVLTPSLLGAHRNCYTYSKRLAEALISQAYHELPLVIARPSIVCPSHKEPVRGWVDNLNGPVGLMIGAGKGVIRTMLVDGSLYAQVIPVDIAINAIIAIGMIEGSKNEKAESIPVYNVNCGHLIPTTWREVLEHGKLYARKRPLSWPLWYPNGSITTNATLHEFRRVCYHLIPAYLIDFLLLILGQKRLMMRIQAKISQGLEVLQFFTMRPWSFGCSNYDSIHQLLNKDEQIIYKTDITNENTFEYLENCIEGGRVYCLKEDPNKNSINKSYHNFLYFIDWICKICFWLLILSFVASWFEPVRTLLSYGEPVVNYLPFVGKVITNKN